MRRVTSLFKDDDSSDNERIHYSWLAHYFPASQYIIYPNAALKVIIDAEYAAVREQLHEETRWIESLQVRWSPRNFFDNASVDLCVIRKSDYLPYVAFEIDGESHFRLGRKKQDQLKTLFFTKARIPLVRLRVHRGRSEAARRKVLEESIERFDCRRFAEPLSDAQGRKVLIADKKGRQYFELLTRTFFSNEYLVLPNVALQSIFPTNVRLAEYIERDRHRRGLLDFCVFETKDFRPIIAFTFTEDPVRDRVLDFFGLPLFDLRRCLDGFDGGSSLCSDDAVLRVQQIAMETLGFSEPTSPL